MGLVYDPTGHVTVRWHLTLFVPPKENHMGKYRKALYALGTAVVAVGAALGLHIDPAAVAAVEGVISTLLVYVVPNDQ